MPVRTELSGAKKVAKKGDIFLCEDDFGKNLLSTYPQHFVEASHSDKVKDLKAVKKVIYETPKEEMLEINENELIED